MRGSHYLDRTVNSILSIGLNRKNLDRCSPSGTGKRSNSKAEVRPEQFALTHYLMPANSSLLTTQVLSRFTEPTP